MNSVSPEIVTSLCHISGVAITMALFGILGAYCRKIWEKDGSKQPVMEIILPGIAAAFVVPIFLSVGGSGIFREALTSNSDYSYNLFLIAGFSILAGVSAPTFVNGLARKALQTAEEAKLQSESAENTAEAVTEEAENKDISRPSVSEEAKAAAKKDLQRGSNEYRVLGALINSDYSRRTIGGIAKAVGIDRGAVKAALSSLIADGRVVESVSKKSGNPLFHAKL